MSHSHDGGPSHSHEHPAGDHGHTHEILDGPGSYMGREMPIIEGRNWSERAFTVGIGGYVHVFLTPAFRDTITFKQYPAITWAGHITCHTVVPTFICSFLDCLVAFKYLVMAQGVIVDCEFANNDSDQ